MEAAENGGTPRAATLSRSDIPGAQRLVIKVGSSSLTRPDGHLDLGAVGRLTKTIAAARGRGGARAHRRAPHPCVVVDDSRIGGRPPTVIGTQTSVICQTCEFKTL